MARPRLLINPWDTQPTQVDAVTDGAQDLNVRNATAAPQRITLTFGSPTPVSLRDSRRVAAEAMAERERERGTRVLDIADETVNVDLAPLKTTTVTVQTRYRPEVGSDGIYMIPYQAAAPGGARAAGHARIVTIIPPLA